MKRLIIALILVICLLVPISCAKGQRGPDTFTRTLPLTIEKTSLEEASTIIGVPIPVPAYLPEGCEIQEIYTKPNPLRPPSHITVILLISDEKIERKLVSYTTRSSLSRQHYEFQCKMAMDIMRLEQWSDSDEPPTKEAKAVDINGVRGWIADEDIHNVLRWCTPSNPPGFGIALLASQTIPEHELIKVAESVQW